MRKIPIVPIIAGMVILVVLTGVVLFVACPKRDSPHATDGQTIVYHCPMHPNYLSHKPGKCPICGMTLVPVNDSAPQKGADKGKIMYYRDAMNPSHTSDKPGKAPDGMDLVPVYEGEVSGSGIKIDPAMMQSIGIQTEKAAIRLLTRDIRTSATIVPDERRITTITTKIMGYVEKLYVNYTGQQVKKGQPLYDLYSPDLIGAQSEYLQAYGNKDSGQLLRSARQRLLNWDVTDEQIAALEKRGVPEKTITVVSGASGIVAEKMIVDGQSIEPGMKLYEIIDYSRVWVEAAIYQQDIPNVKVGQQSTIELDYYPGEQFDGVVAYVAPELNTESRTLMVRLELANTADIRIKPGMNATVTIHAAMSRSAITVPEQAVLHSGLRTLVIIAIGGGYFEPREITIGQSAGGYTEVIEGVNDGEEIVVTSQFLIDSESNLKAAVMKMNSKQPTPEKGAAASDTVVNGMTSTNPETKAAATVNEKILYTCPMHPEVVSDLPGSCPKCGMPLVPKKKDVAPDTTSSMKTMPGK